MMECQGRGEGDGEGGSGAQTAAANTSHVDLDIRIRSGTAQLAHQQTNIGTTGVEIGDPLKVLKYFILFN